MKAIPLTRGGVAIVDDEDGDLGAHKWHLTHYGYAARRHSGKILLMHRVIIGAPDGSGVDHVNGHKTDNRRANLRFCTQSQNNQNQQKLRGGTSRYKGVSLHRKSGKWYASIRLRGKTVSLGLYESERAAAEAYDLAAVRHFGEFAATNRDHAHLAL